MIVTEKAAAGMACVAGIQSGKLANICNGSRCMAWRFVPEPGSNNRVYGYCGLAGAPIDALSVAMASAVKP